MTTSAQKFYLDTSVDDGSYGTTVNKLAEVAPSANSATTNTWSSSTASAETHVPLTASSTASDTSSNNGWAFNNGGADGLGSVTGARRFIGPGVWNFSMSYTLNSPALLATIACAVAAKVYRVATGGGTRTLLFTATSANFSATAVVTWASASQPEIVLDPGEVIEVGFVPTSAATAATVIGAITNTVLTLNLGASSFINLPTKVKTLADGAGSSSGVGTALAVGAAIFAGIYSSSGLGTATGVGAAIFSGVYSSSGTGAANGVGASRFAGVYSSNGLGAANGIGSSIFSATFSSSGVGSASALATAIFAGVYTVNGVAVVAGVGAPRFSGVFAGSGFATVLGFGSSVAATVANASGAGIANGQITKVLGAVGICNIGSGGTTTVIRRIVHIEED